MAFNFVGRLQLVGPTNLGQIVSQINRQLSGIRANININISPNTSARINALNTQLSGLNTQLSQVALNAQRAQAALTNLATGLNNLNSVTLKLPSSLNSSNSALSTTATVANDASQGIKQFGEQAGLATRRFLAFSLAAGSLVGIASFFKQGIQNAIEFERQLTRLNQVGSGTREELKGIASEISRVSTAYGSSSKDLSEVAVTLRQAGLEARDVRLALDALAQTTISPSFGNLNNTVEGLIATFSQFRITAAQSAEVLGSINAVSAGLAVEAEDITSAISKAGGAFALLANASNSPIQNLREFISVFSSVRATTRESADTIATGLRSIFTRFQRPEVVDSLRELGINLRFTRAEAQALGNTSLENQFVGAYEAVVRLSEGLRSIPNTSSQFAQIVESLGGIRQVSRILPLLSEGGIALRQQALALSQAGATSLNDSTQKGLESLAVRGRQVFEEFQKLFRLITEDSGFQVFAKSLLILAEGLAKVLQFAKPLIPVLLTLAASNIFKSLGTFGAGFAQKFVSSQGSSYYNIRGYATGGKVSGTGNKDTEIAALTPGEYVVPKTAAQRIGYNNLEEMSKGGDIQRFAIGGRSGLNTRFGTPRRRYLDPPNNFFYLKDGKLFNRPTTIGIGANLGSDLIAGNETAKISQSQKFEAGSFLITGINPNAALGRFYNRSRTFYENRAKEVSGGSKKIQDYLSLNNSNSPYLSVIGTEFEVYGQRLLTKNDAINTDQNLGADINTIKAPAFRNINRVTRNLTEFIDFSGSKAAQRYGKFPKPVVDYLNSLPETQRRVYIDYSNVDIGDFKNKIDKNSEESLIKQLQTGLTNRKLKKFAGGGIVPGVGNSDSFPAVLNEGDYVIKKSSAQRAGYPALQALANNKFAEGGVVPALLMPGEFVFDQQQASRIGKANLDNLNRTGDTKGIRKYAYGGFVKMANGATPLEAFLSSGAVPGFSFSNRNIAQTGTAITSISSTIETALKKRVNAILANATAEEKQAVVAREMFSFLNQTKELQQKRFEYDKTLAKIKQDEIRVARSERVVSSRLSRGDITGAAQAQLKLEERRDRLNQNRVNLDAISAREKELVASTSIIQDSRGNVSGFAGQQILPSQDKPGLFRRFKDPNTALLAAQLTLPFIGQAAESFAGEATANSGGRFIAGKTVGGALSGIATGAALGGTFGPIGAGIGAVVGGITGLVTSFTGASREIQEAKVGEALKNVTSSLEILNTELRNTGRISEGSLATFRERSSILGRETLARETSDATGIFGRIGGSSETTFGTRVSLFGLESGGLISSLLGRGESRRISSPTTLAEAYTRAISTPAEERSADVSAFIRRYESSAIERLPRLLEPARFLARGALDSGRGRGVSAIREGLGEEDFGALVASLGGLRGFGEFLRSVERESVRASDTPIFNQFSKLSSTLDALNTSFLTLANTSQNLDSVLSGSGQQARNVPVNLNNFNDPNFARNAETVRSGLGLNGLVGREFTRFTTSATLLTENLEASLREAGTGGVDRASTILRDRLSGRVDESLITRLTRRVGAIELTPGADLGRVASETVASIFPPELQRLAEVYNTRQSAIIDSLNRYNNVLKQSIELGLRINELSQQEENVRAGFEAQNRGLGSGAGVLFSRTSSDDRFRQDLRTILSGIPGGLNENSSAAQFGAENRRIQEVLSTTPEGAERGNLLRASSAYTQALQRMADVTTRTASIQENLNRLEQSREARLNFNQRYLTADPESRARTNRGLLLAQNAFNSGADIGSTSLENRRLIFESLSQIGNGRLGFAGGLTGNELARQFSNNTRFGITQPAGETEQINTLQQQILTVYQQANEATVALRSVVQNDLVLSNNNLRTTQEQLRLATVNLTTAIEREVIGGPIRTAIRDFLPEGIRSSIGFNSGGPVPYYASRGLMNRGPDTVPAMLTPGEYVINAGAASRNRGLLEAINGNYLSFGGPLRRPIGFNPYLPVGPASLRISDEASSSEDITSAGLTLGTRISRDYLNRQSLLTEASIGRGLRNNLYERQVVSRFSENFGSGTQLSALQQENQDLLNRRNNSGFIGANLDFNTGRRLTTPSNFVSGSFFNIPGSDVRELRRRRRVLGGLGALLPLGLADGGLVRITQAEIDEEIRLARLRRESVDGPEHRTRILDAGVERLTTLSRTSGTGLFITQAQIDAAIAEYNARRLGSTILSFTGNIFGTTSRPASVVPVSEPFIPVGGPSDAVPIRPARVISAEETLHNNRSRLLSNLQRNGLSREEAIRQMLSSYPFRPTETAREAIFSGLSSTEFSRITSPREVRPIGLPTFAPETVIDRFRRETAERDERDRRRYYRADGGPIYANNGLFVPRGTDTIPAMLSPGEYVINRRSTEQFRPLLEQINNNRFANGGPVGKVDQGFGPGVDTSGFSEASRNISRSFVDFGNSVRQLTQAIEAMPTNIQLTANHRVEIIHNGVEIFAKMEPMIRDLVVGETSKQLNQFVKDKLPDIQ